MYMYMCVRVCVCVGVYMSAKLEIVFTHNVSPVPL